MGSGQVIFAQVPQSMPAPDALAKSPRVQTTVVDGIEMMEGNPVRREKMTKMRRLIAEHMVESVRVSPHVTTVFEVDLHNVYEIREKHRAPFEAREGFKLTYTPFFIHAAVQAIKQHPIINVSLDGDDILWKQDINVGCAVALGNGLIVPVIKKAQDLNLTGVAHRLNDLVSRARSKKLMPEDVQGGTFSITNPGGFGSLTSNPIINQPQVAILGIGAVVKRPVVINDAITIRPMMMISLTFDHRVVDGEGGASYLATLKKILENYSEEPV
jgi:2-oxoglutarate dehydrogenase E2 component (dihydrolipoamide succinyltransferase)